ncbi:uncharacterized protein LOC141651109 [Silene latifolia]|uniref:uncharacterized protein LOC141651109 n=1 Tax=Silene latifolia TaxID=37657 RepID=UPI003D778BF8
MARTRGSMARNRPHTSTPKAPIPSDSSIVVNGDVSMAEFQAPMELGTVNELISSAIKAAGITRSSPLSSKLSSANSIPLSTTLIEPNPNSSSDGLAIDVSKVVDHSEKLSVLVDNTVVPSVSLTSVPVVSDVVGKTPVKTWSHVVKAPQNLGMSLHFCQNSAVASEIDIEETDFVDELKIWEFTLMGHVIGAKATLKIVQDFVTKHWAKIATPVVQYYKKGWISFRFSSLEDMNKVLRLGPWMIGGNSLILKQWTPTFSGNMERVATVPVWILFPGLDPYLWSEIVLSKIASKVGKPLFADPATTNKEKLSFARVLVEIDVSSEFIESVVINTPFLGQISQKVVYEWVPFYCSGCGKLGHKIDTCSTASIQVPTVVEEQLNEVTQPYDADPFLDGTFTEVSADGAVVISSSQHGSFPLANKFQVLEPGEILESDAVVSETSLELGATSEGTTTRMVSTLENVDSGCSLIGQRSSVVMPSSSGLFSELHSECSTVVLEVKEVVPPDKVKEHNASKIIRKKFRNWNVVCNYSHHYNGRIWVFFNPSTVTMLSKTVADQLIHFKVHHHESYSTFHLSTVYGCNHPLDRHRLWSSLAAVNTSEPWLVLGDFNVVRSPSEKLSNTPPVLQDMLDFNDCLASCHLDDLTCTGVDMSWTNKQDSVTRVWSKLDRVLANPGFITSYPNAFGHFQEPGLSDHSPILVQISQDKKVVKRFSFLNSWIAHPDYLQTIRAAWITPLQGSPMYCFFQKLKSVKHALTQFHKQHFSNISHRVQSAKNALMECQQ